MAETKTPPQVIELYGGKVSINFHPKSHRYYITRKNGEDLLKQYQPSSVSSISGLVDKSQFLVPWATRVYTAKVLELMGDKEDAVFNRQDVEAMLAVGEIEHDEIKKRSAGIGDYVHAFCEEYSKVLDKEQAYSNIIEKLGAPTEDDQKKIKAGIDGFVKWTKEEGVKILSAEEVIYSEKWDYVGKYDATLTLKSFLGEYLADYKTGNGIYNSHYYQASGYLKAKEEESGKKYAGALLIAICKEDDEKKGKKAGDIIVEVRSRGDLLQDFIAFKGLLPVKAREKQLAKEWRANNKK